MKAVPYLPLSLIQKVVNYFVQLKVKIPMRGQVFVINIFFEFLAFLVLINPCRQFSGVIFDTKQDEDKSNFLFFYELEFLAELQIHLLCIFPDLYIHILLPL